jgi:hypothetical protein
VNAIELLADGIGERNVALGSLAAQQLEDALLGLLDELARPGLMIEDRRLAVD